MWNKNSGFVKYPILLFSIYIYIYNTNIDINLIVKRKIDRSRDFQESGNLSE